MSTEKSRFAKLKRSDNVIPAYDHLFTDEGSSKNTKRGILLKLMKMNAGGILLTALLFLFQTSPVYVVPIVTSDIIDTVTNAISANMVNSNVWRRIAIDALIIFVFLIQNVPSKIGRAHV